MRALKVLLITLLALGALVLVLFLIGPSRTVVERTVAMNAPASVIYPKIASLETMHGWSPWSEMDRDQVTEFTGEDGAVGSKQTWSGDTVGVGVMEVLELTPDQHVGLDLRFSEPFESRSKVDFDLVSEGAATRVTRRMTTDNGFISRIMCVFFDTDAMIGSAFEQGLNNLKAIAEAEHAEAAQELAARTVKGYVINTVERPATVYVGKRNKRLKWDDMDKFFGESFGGAAAAIGGAGLEMIGPPTGVYFVWNEADRTTDLLAGFPVKAAEPGQFPGFEVYTVPASRMLHIAYYGSYEDSMAPHEAMNEYIETNNLTHYGNVIEEYVTDPRQEPDTSKWLTNIYYMVK
jgi:effector-binding domain-containing protein